MKIKAFPASTRVVRALCDCGGELKYAGTAVYAISGELYDHTCTKCKTTESLSNTYPRIVTEQSSSIGDDYEEK
jgi:hypothetical protein